MTYKIMHRLPGRIRLNTGRYTLTVSLAKAAQAFFSAQQGIVSVNVSSITGSILIVYMCPEKDILGIVAKLKLSDLSLHETHLHADSESLVIDLSKKLLFHYLVRPILPVTIRIGITILSSLSYFKKGLKNLLVDKRVSVEVLDAAAVGSALIQKNFSTAGSIMFLLSVSEMIEYWSKKRAKANLADSLSLNIDNVWVFENGIETFIPTSSLSIGDVVIVRTGGLIPIDGTVIFGDAMVNQSTMTGEPLPVKRDEGKTVFAGTIVEEGSIRIEITALRNDTRIHRIMKLIDESENYKSALQSKNERLADAIVPFSFVGAFGVYLLTGSFLKASSVFFVDYSCAIKLSTSLSILGGLHEASTHQVLIKGGRFLEEMAEADTIVFDKTGTLTAASPVVKDVIPYGGRERDEVLKIAACLEEHFPHSVAKAVVEKAKQEKLEHQEEHAEVEYIIAHGIASYLNGKRVLIGSEHFIFEDEKTIRGELEDKFLHDNIGEESVLYLSIDGELAGIILIIDPVRETAKISIEKLRDLGLEIIMLTGDSEKTASAVAEKLCIHKYKAQVLPEGKSMFIAELKAQGHKVIMVGDGINDTLALSGADVGISMKDSSDLARSVADVSLLSSEIDELASIIFMSRLLKKRINQNFKFIIAFNSLLLALGLFEFITPGNSALFHNFTTLGVGINSIRPHLK